MSTPAELSARLRHSWPIAYTRSVPPAIQVEAADAIDALQAQVEVLEKALQPFSDAAGVYFAKNYNKIDCIDDHYGTILAGSLFEARAAICSRSNDSQPAPSPVENRDVLTARNTVASPISQEGSIAPDEALSEGGEQ